MEENELNAILLYHSIPCYDNFMTIVESITPSISIKSDIVDIALVYSGCKKMCFIEELPEFINQLNLNIISYNNSYVLYHDISLKTHAELFVDYLKSYKQEDDIHDYIMNRYLS